MPCGRPRNANWKFRNFWSSVTTWRFLRATRRAWNEKSLGVPEEHAEDEMSHHQALVLARSGRLQQAPLDAVERLQRALPYDFALPGTGFIGKFGGGYPAYVRGEAYLAARRGQEAAAEFQKVLDHRGVVAADPVGVLAHLQMGRAY